MFLTRKKVIIKLTKLNFVRFFEITVFDMKFKGNIVSFLFIIGMFTLLTQFEIAKFKSTLIAISDEIPTSKLKTL